MSRSSHIRILMCTHNGARYLREQLDSFLAQTHADWSLWISDDASTDATPGILSEFRQAHPQRDIRLLRGPGRGGTENFLRLLAQSGPGDGLVALSDQDDVWLPDKLERAARAMAAASRSPQPVAYGAGWFVTDENLRSPRRSRPAPRGPSFGNALVQNVLSGHSLVLNDAARRLVAETGRPPAGIACHDWWIYLRVAGAGGRMILDDAPVLCYRQHGDNAMGANIGLRSRLRRLALLFGGDYARWIDGNARALAGRQRDLTPEHREILARFLAARAGGGLARARAWRALGIHRQSRLETLVLLAAAVLGYL